MSKHSSNALTKRWAESNGFFCETVERFYGGKRHDLFGFVDSILLFDGAVVFIQNCSYGTLKSHRDAISAHPLFPVVRACGLVELWEWRRRKVKRGGKRIARQWWLRRQTSIAGGAGWAEPGAWIGPLDLYARSPIAAGDDSP